jgi:hypothetical protein
LPAGLLKKVNSSGVATQYLQVVTAKTREKTDQNKRKEHAILLLLFIRIVLVYVIKPLVCFSCSFNQG